MVCELRKYFFSLYALCMLKWHRNIVSNPTLQEELGRNLLALCFKTVLF